MSDVMQLLNISGAIQSLNLGVVLYLGYRLDRLSKKSDAQSAMLNRVSNRMNFVLGKMGIDPLDVEGS